MKVLILRFSSIGDIVLTTPVVRCIKQQVKNAEVHYFTKKGFETLIKDNPYIDKYFLLKDNIKPILALLKQEKYDLIIDLHNNLRTRIIKNSLWSVKSYSFDKINWQKFLYVKFKAKSVMPNKHVVERYMEPAIKALNIKNDNQGLDYFIPSKDNVDLDSLPSTFQTREYYTYVIGGQYFTKQLPTQRIIEFCQGLNQPIILLGGKDDNKVGEEIETFFKDSKTTTIFNACGKFNLNQSASLIQQAKLVISHDTGLMHIASALKKEIISIWGNTTPELGFYPYQTQYTVLQNENLDCRPCSKIGFHECPKSHFKCMNDINFNNITIQLNKKGCY
ncbi:MAG: glycosyltransferase family 9 protein [Cytophagales bacterium]|nr:glycosyltransferase family 9 protein [Cytophagales bacterium]